MTSGPRRRWLRVPAGPRAVGLRRLEAVRPLGGVPRPVRRRLAERGSGRLPSAPFSSGLPFSPEAYAAGLERIRGFFEEAGRDPDELDPAYYQDVVADTEAEALKTARSFLERYYPDASDLTDEQVRQRGVFGPPERVREHFEVYADAGVRTFVIRFTAEDQAAQLRRLSDVLDIG